MRPQTILASRSGCVTDLLKDVSAVSSDALSFSGSTRRALQIQRTSILYRERPYPVSARLLAENMNGSSQVAQDLASQSIPTASTHHAPGTSGRRSSATRMQNYVDGATQTITTEIAIARPLSGFVKHSSSLVSIKRASASLREVTPIHNSQQTRVHDKRAEKSREVATTL